MSSAIPDPYPSTPSFTPTPRFLTALSSFYAMHATDPAPPSPSSSSTSPPSVTYHSTLETYARKLSLQSTDERLNQGPGEALLLACASQHVRRWERPRADYPEGLSGYKLWRTSLNKFHADIADEVLLSSGYSSTDDAALLARVRELLLKKTLNRPPLPRPEELKDPESHLFEDSICLTFLHLHFLPFSQPYLSSTPSSLTSDPAPSPAKLGGIVSKTWAKMTPLGRGVAVEELVGGLPDELKAVVVEAVSGVKDAYTEQ